jgi:hypothetical protein
VTTAATAATADAILALDLGKYKSVACAYDPADAEPRFHTIPTSRAEPRQPLDCRRPAFVVIEACTPTGRVHDHCACGGSWRGRPPQARASFLGPRP